MTVRLDICPLPTPRPRVKHIIKHGKRINLTFYPPHYQAYKTELSWIVKSKKIPKKDYSKLYVTFALPYPKQVDGGAKNKIESKPCRNKCDVDNLLKGLKDALQDCGIINDDRQLWKIEAAKIWTNSQGYISFLLEEGHEIE